MLKLRCARSIVVVFLCENIKFCFIGAADIKLLKFLNVLYFHYSNHQQDPGISAVVTSALTDQ